MGGYDTGLHTVLHVHPIFLAEDEDSGREQQSAYFFLGEVVNS